MTKYEIILNRLHNSVGDERLCDVLTMDDISDLQKAVEKAEKWDEKETPKEVNIKTELYAHGYFSKEIRECPECSFEGLSKKDKYCRNCGTRLE